MQATKPLQFTSNSAVAQLRSEPVTFEGHGFDSCLAQESMEVFRSDILTGREHYRAGDDSALRRFLRGDRNEMLD